MKLKINYENAGNVQNKEQFFENFKEDPDLLEMVKNLYPNPIEDLKILEDRKHRELLQADENSEDFAEKITKATIISLVIKNKIDNDNN